jgi:hypothetical protein
VSLAKKRRTGVVDQNKKKARNVKVSHNALDKDLNMAKQYKNRYDCCIKDLVKWTRRMPAAKGIARTPLSPIK